MNQTEAMHGRSSIEATVQAASICGLHALVWSLSVYYRRETTRWGRQITAALMLALIGMLLSTHLESTADDMYCQAVLFLPIPVVVVAIWRRVHKVFLTSRPASSSSDETGPFLLPCRTTHTRMFPVKHSFSYSYLQVAVPVGWVGSRGSLIGVDLHSQTEGLSSWWYWFTVDARDHLYRSHSGSNLMQKLADYLKSQSIDPLDYDSAWLVTAPRFLGYSFNPVSFWYLYQGATLKSMILEVNNTFDERRMYLMDMEPNSQKSSSNSVKHRASFAKDFHVSPFSSRKGSYALTAVPPAFAAGISIDNTISQLSSKHHTKLVARVFGTAPPLDARAIPAFKRLRFIAGWFWIGFATSPRILKEAAVLYFRKGLHVWYRPEVLPGSVGRVETKQEATIELCWRRYLADLAESSGVPIRYVASGHAEPRESLFTSSLAPAADREAGASPAEPVNFEVLTPAFYSELALASSATAYIAGSAGVSHDQRTFVCSALDKFVAMCTEARYEASVRHAADEKHKQTPSDASYGLDMFGPSVLPPDLLCEFTEAKRTLARAERYAFGSVALYEIGAFILELLVSLLWPALLYFCLDIWLGERPKLRRDPMDVVSMMYIAMHKMTLTLNHVPKRGKEVGR